MGYIFMSYSRRQLYFAEAVVLNLQRAGIETWFDLQKLTPGVDWASTLKDGYSNCETLILLASQFAIQSPYVRVEWETALQNGREVIIVLTEPVVLPDALRSCPVYDARTHFDRTLQSLIACLRGEVPPRHDPVPAPGKYPYPFRIPFDVWLTLTAMFMATLSVWIATFSIPISSVHIDIDLHIFDFITKYTPGLPAYAILFYLIGIYYGFNLIQAQFPFREFWRHDVSYEELKKIRWKLLQIQMSASVLALICTVLVPGSLGQPINPVGYLVFLCPLITAYWSFGPLGRSPDILRWMPSGEIDQEVREQIQEKVSADLQEPSHDQEVVAVNARKTFAIYYHPADAYNARYIKSVLRSEGCQTAPEGDTTLHLILVSNRTSKEWLLKLNKTLAGQLIHILTTNINTPPDLQPVLQTQWVDFRNGRIKTLRALAAYLTNRGNANVDYGLQSTPTGFDSAHGFPRWVGLVIGSFFVIILIPFAVLGLLGIGEERLIIGLGLVSAVSLVLYVDALVMRKVSLPSWVHKLMGHRVAWFASPAATAPDPIGNTDRKYAYKLSSSILKS